MNKKNRVISDAPESNAGDDFYIPELKKLGVKVLTMEDFNLVG